MSKPNWIILHLTVNHKHAAQGVLNLYMSVLGPVERAVIVSLFVNRHFICICSCEPYSNATFLILSKCNISDSCGISTHSARMIFLVRN